jgi:hypothetical protein
MAWAVPTALQTVLSAVNLQNLANNASVNGATYDNTSAKDELADFMFNLKYASITGITAGTKVADVYLVAMVDAATLPSQAGTPSIPQGALYIGSLESRAPSTTVLETLNLPFIQIPPFKFQIVFANVSGQGLANDATMIGKMQPYSP